MIARNNGASRRGFSLIEMLAVLAIISMVTVSITIRWSSIYHDVQFKSGIARMIDFDFKARRHAADRHRSGELIIDIEDQTIRATRWVNASAKKIRMKLDSTNFIESVSDVDSETSEGKVVIPISNVGATPTYSVLVRQGEKRRWIVFAGRTGQSQEFDNVEQVNQMFAAMRLASAN